MLYLFTGVPGSGKTLAVISMLAKRKDFRNRPLFIDGIPDVDPDKIPHFAIPEGESIQTWPKWAPPGAIIVVDECQRIFRPRPSGSKVPDYVSELETHRHRGLDFLLITQNPRLIDVNLRSLIEHHTHFSKTNLGLRRKLEWTTGGAKDPDSRANIKEALVSIYKLDSSVYGLYKSSEVHTKIKVKKSKALIVFPLSILAMCVAFYYASQLWQDFKKPIEPHHVAAQAASPASGAAVGAPAPNGATVAGRYPAEPKRQQEKPYISQDDYKARIDGRPETAPIYDGLNRAVKTMPFPVACISGGKSGCTCYTSQATPIKEIKKAQCLDYVKNGIYNPYKDESAAQTQPDAAKQGTSEHASVAMLDAPHRSNLMYDGYNEARLDAQ